MDFIRSPTPPRTKRPSTSASTRLSPPEVLRLNSHSRQGVDNARSRKTRHRSRERALPTPGQPPLPPTGTFWLCGTRGHFSFALTVCYPESCQTFCQRLQYFGSRDRIVQG